MDIKLALKNLSHKNCVLWYITRKIHLSICHKCVLKKTLNQILRKKKRNNIYEDLTTLNSGSACCHSLQNVSYSYLLLENVRHKICEADSHPVFVCGFEI